MKIIIVGAGQVGSSLSINLVKEGNDVTLIDKSADLLENIADKVDLQTIHGNGAHPRILEAAGAHKADMIVAVSKSDETNMIACQVAYTVFGVSKKIARIRDIEYLNYENLFADEFNAHPPEKTSLSEKLYEIISFNILLKKNS